MLKDLKILNGTLEINFNEYINEYTVVVKDDVKSLEFSYKLEDDSYLDIFNNNILDKDENIVYIKVYNNDLVETYTFYVYKENTNYTSLIDNYKKSLEVINNVEVETYKLQLLTSGVFLSIVIVFSIIFKRKKIK